MNISRFFQIVICCVVVVIGSIFFIAGCNDHGQPVGKQVQLAQTPAPVSTPTTSPADTVTVEVVTELTAELVVSKSASNPESVVENTVHVKPVGNFNRIGAVEVILKDQVDTTGFLLVHYSNPQDARALELMFDRTDHKAGLVTAMAGYDSRVKPVDGTIRQMGYTIVIPIVWKWRWDDERSDRTMLRKNSFFTAPFGVKQFFSQDMQLVTM